MSRDLEFFNLKYFRMELVIFILSTYLFYVISLHMLCSDLQCLLFFFLYNIIFNGKLFLFCCCVLLCNIPKRSGAINRERIN